MTISENLLSKSIESITLAIELYNKPLIKYRTESVVILIVNSWENLLKALIKKEKWAKIYDKNKEESKHFSECVECVKSNLGKSYSDDWYESTKLLYEKRCKIVHYYKDLEVIDYMMIQSNIILFKDFVQKHFGKSIIKDKNWYILPIASELPYTDFDFIKSTSALKKTNPEIKSYIERVLNVHSKQVESPFNKGILINIKVSLENIKNIKRADAVFGIDKESEKRTALDGGLKLSDEGRSVKIQEISETLQKYKYHYSDVLKVARGVVGHSQKKFNQFMKEIRNDKNIAFNWGTFSNIFPMQITNKYTYAEGVIEKYKKYIQK